MNRFILFRSHSRKFIGIDVLIYPSYTLFLVYLFFFVNLLSPEYGILFSNQISSDYLYSVFLYSFWNIFILAYYLYIYYSLLNFFMDIWNSQTTKNHILTNICVKIKLKLHPETYVDLLTERNFKTGQRNTASKTRDN